MENATATAQTVLHTTDIDTEDGTTDITISKDVSLVGIKAVVAGIR